MRYLLLLVVMASPVGCGDQRLVQTPDPRCGQACYPDAGACVPGAWSCDAAQQVVSCVGFIAGPDCSDGGLGDVCDRVVGSCPCSAGATRPCYDGPAGTEGVGICHAGSETCDPGGSWGPCSGEQTPQPESCNCLDDDCNGVVDDIPPNQYCYDGPANSAGVGICHPGVLACNGPPSCGSYCAGEQLPEPGACSGSDDACGGVSQGPIDFVFLLDDTDSSCANGMGVPELIQAQQTLATFAYQNPQSGYRFGLIVMPGCGGQWLPGPNDAGYTLDVPLGDAQQFLPLASLQCAVDAVDDPPCATNPFFSYDVLYQQATGSIIPWDPGAQQRYLIMFTGAKGESQLGLTASDVQQALTQNGVIPILFIGNGHRSGYDACVANTPGTDFDLGNLPQMLAEVALSLVLPCGTL
jgi:hypothetical protein